MLVGMLLGDFGGLPLPDMAASARVPGASCRRSELVNLLRVFAGWVAWRHGNGRCFRLPGWD